MISWQGLSSYKARVRRSPGKLRRQTIQDVETWRLGVVYQSMTDAPVDLGALRQSINSEPFNEGLGGKASVNVPYAAFVEFGTGAGVLIPPGWAEVAARFKGAGKRKVTLQPQPYFIPAVMAETEKLKARLRNNLRTLLE